MPCYLSVVFLGVSNKLFAVPWNALTLNPNDKSFSLDVKKETLEEAPGFDKGDWPDMVNPQWDREIHEYYKQPSYWQ